MHITNIHALAEKTTECHLQSGALQYTPLHKPGVLRLEFLFDSGDGTNKLLLKHLQHVVANSTRNVSMVAMHTVVKGVLKDDRGGMDMVWGKSSPGEPSIFKSCDELHG